MTASHHRRRHVVVHLTQLVVHFGGVGGVGVRCDSGRAVNARRPIRVRNRKLLLEELGAHAGTRLKPLGDRTAYRTPRHIAQHLVVIALHIAGLDGSILPVLQDAGAAGQAFSQFVLSTTWLRFNVGGVVH